MGGQASNEGDRLGLDAQAKQGRSYMVRGGSPWSVRRGEAGKAVNGQACWDCHGNAG